MPHFDRFDICEAWSCLAHDWGLYAIQSRLDRLSFTPRPDLTSDTLEPNAQEIYDYWDGRFRDPNDNAYTWLLAYHRALGVAQPLLDPKHAQETY